MRQPQNFKNFNNQLGIISECPLCKAKIIDLNVIEEAANSYLIHSKCKKCGNSVLLLALSTEIGVNVIGMTTDLSMEEIIKLRGREAISADDAINLHELLKQGEFFNQLIS